MFQKLNMRLDAPLARAAKTAFALCALAITAPAVAGPVVTGFTTNTLARNDDGSTSVVTLPFAVNFFGTTYSNTFVNNNGNITFTSPLATFTPSALNGPTAVPIIAPFFADVDTRGAASGLTSYGNGTFNGYNAFGVTWPGVGYFGSHTDKLNTFQLLLVDRGDTGTGNFDIYFNYDQMLWETGDASGGSNGFGGTSAAAGYSAGAGTPGTFAQLQGSLVNGALIDGGSNALTANSNIGVAGRYLFNVRDGSVTAPPVGSAVPEPATWAMMIGGFGMVGGSMRYRRRKTTVSFA
jgi:hypothetical protein